MADTIETETPVTLADDNTSSSNELTSPKEESAQEEVANQSSEQTSCQTSCQDSCAESATREEEEEIECEEKESTTSVASSGTEDVEMADVEQTNSESVANEQTHHGAESSSESDKHEPSSTASSTPPALTPDKMKHEEEALYEAYTVFWRNSAFAYQQSWNKPTYSLDSCSSLLQHAASLAIHARAALGEQLFGVHNREGSASEYLWKVLSGSEDPQANPVKFVRGLVHATFSNERGLVAGLTAKRLDGILKELHEPVLTERSKRLLHEQVQLASTLQELVEPITSLVHSLRNQELLPCHNLADLHQIANNVQHLRNTVDILVRAKSELKDYVELDRESLRQSMDAESRAALLSSAAEMAVEVDQAAVNEPEPEPSEAKDESAPILLEIKKMEVNLNKMNENVKRLVDSADQLQIGDDLEASDHQLKNLQKRCTQYTGELMNDLLAIDSQNTTPSTRPLRKEVVNRIQALLDTIDQAKNKLRKVHQELSKKQEAEAAEAAAEAAAKAAAASATAAAASAQSSARSESPAKDETASPTLAAASDESDEEEVDDDEEKNQIEASGKLDWASLKLQPRFAVRDVGAAYIIDGYVPNMSGDDIALRIGKDPRSGRKTLTIEGIRIPSAAEELQMRQHVAQSIAARFGSVLDRIPLAQFNELVLRAGFGRFGKFSETYEMPRDVNEDDMAAKYDNGVLRVTLPKSAPRRQPQPHISRGGGRRGPPQEDILQQLLGGGRRDPLFW